MPPDTSGHAGPTRDRCSHRPERTGVTRAYQDVEQQWGDHLHRPLSVGASGTPQVPSGYLTVAFWPAAIEPVVVAVARSRAVETRAAASVGHRAKTPGRRPAVPGRQGVLALRSPVDAREPTRRQPGRRAMSRRAPRRQVGRCRLSRLATPLAFADPGFALLRPGCQRARTQEHGQTDARAAGATAQRSS